MADTDPIQSPSNPSGRYRSTATRGEWYTTCGCDAHVIVQRGAKYCGSCGSNALYRSAPVADTTTNMPAKPLAAPSLNRQWKPTPWRDMQQGGQWRLDRDGDVEITKGVRFISVQDVGAMLAAAEHQEAEPDA